jgi:hypothetical protein
VTAVLFSATNASHLENVLQIMNEGILNIVNDFIVQKTCVRFFRVLLEQLDASPAFNDPISTERSQYRKGILKFICQVVLPNIFHSLLNRPTVLRDANGGRVVSELGQLLHALSKACMNDMVEQQEYQNCLIQILQRHAAGGTDESLSTLQEPSSTVNDIVACLNQLLQSATRNGR